MSQSNLIPANLLARMNQSVLALPPKPPKSQTEAVEYMTPAFKQALNRGYSLEDIQAHIQKEFGITLQMSKMKRAVSPSENAQAETAAKPKKKVSKKQTDKPATTPNGESGPVDANSSTQNAAEDKQETQTAATVVAASMPTSGTEIAEGKAENAGGNMSENQTVAPITPQENPPASIEKIQKEKVSSRERVDLNCPKYQKDEAKSLGAKWDQGKCVWYVPAGLDLTPFEKWLKKPLEEYRQKVEFDELIKDGTFEVRPDRPDGEL